MFDIQYKKRKVAALFTATSLALLFTHFTSLSESNEAVCLAREVKHSLYVNRDERADRRRHIVSQLERARIRTKRIPAVEVFHDNEVLETCWDGGSRKCAGQVGCQRSHLKALEFAKRKGWEHVAIFEDDFQWQEYVDVLGVQCAIAKLKALVKDWDVIAISLNIQDSSPVEEHRVRVGPSTVSRVVKIHSAMATHGYLVRATMLDEIYTAFKLCNVTSDLFIAIDTCWNSLQLKYNWYGLLPQLGTQGDSFSDIESRQVSYRHEYGI
tara:strand:- start:406 stop:1209 length:804 start_codon:yes stop_codon:yes gene_type:complete